MRFSCPKCWDNPCTCGHEQREGDKLRAEVARDCPPPAAVEKYRPGPQTREAVATALDIGATAALAYLNSRGYKGERTAAAIRALPIPMPFQAEPTVDVSTFARQLIEVANAAADYAVGTHNSFTLCAWPGATVTQVLATWNERQKASYFGGGR